VRPTDVRRLWLKFPLWVLIGAFLTPILRAQDLAPRAYVITPLHSNAVILTYAFYNGSVLFDGVVPITGATASVSVPVISLYHSIRFFGRSANLTASLPYGVGHFRGTVAGAEGNAYRSGLLDSEFRFSVNVKGGPGWNPMNSRTGDKRLFSA
jgi:hypothetical protein